MAVYYNENDPFLAEWLRKLIAAGLIAPGDVDERDIHDVRADEVAGYSQCHWFAGIGGWSAALRLSGWPDDRPVWTGSCPCQPFSSTGKRRGFDDRRHLWPVFYGLIREGRPAVVFGEQVGGDGILSWIDLVSDDLEACAYTAWSLDFPAASVGAPGKRQRLFWVAYPDGNGRLKRARNGTPAGHWPLFASDSCNGDGRTNGFWRDADWLKHTDGTWRPVRPGSFPLAHGIPGRVAILRGIGNAIVPQAGAAFIKAVMKELG